MANAELDKIVLQLVITDSVSFRSMASHPENKLYFLADTEEIYRGDVPFGTSILFYQGGLRPIKGADRKIYIDKDSLNGYVYNNSTNTWTEIIHQYEICTELLDKSKNDELVSVQALRKYIETAISEMTYNPDDYSIEYVQGNINRSVVIKGLLSPKSFFDELTNELVLLNVGDQEVARITIPKDSFLVDGRFDPITNKIILYLNVIDPDTGKPKEISFDASALVDVQVADVPGNLLRRVDGGYCVTIDLTGKVDKVEPKQTLPDGSTYDPTNRVILATEDGGINVSDKFIGGVRMDIQTLPDGRKQGRADLLATESAVYHLVKDINDNIDKLFENTITQDINKDSPDEHKYPSEVAIVNEIQIINDSIKKLNDDLTDLISNNTQEFDDKLTEQINSAKNDLNNSISSLSDSINRANQSITTNANDISNIKTAIEGINEAISSLTSEHETYNAKFEEIATSIENLQSAISSLENGISSINNNIDSINTNITQLSEQHYKFEEETNSKISDIENAINSMGSSSESEISSIKGQINNINESISNISDTVSAVQNQHATDMTNVETNISAIDSKIDSAYKAEQADVEVLNKAIDALRESTNTSLSTVTSEINDLKQTSSELTDTKIQYYL